MPLIGRTDCCNQRYGQNRQFLGQAVYCLLYPATQNWRVQNPSFQTVGQRLWEPATAARAGEREIKGIEEKRRTDTPLARATLFYHFHWARIIQVCFYCTVALHQPFSHTPCWLTQAMKLFLRENINLCTKIYPLDMLTFLINLI